MILTKIGKQANYQLKHNRRDFYISLRVASVIVFQTAINSILVFLEFTESIDDIFYDVFKVKLEKHKKCRELDFYYPVVSVCVDSFQLPEWLDDDDMEFGIEGPTVYPAVKQLRIFLESVIILAVMVGYREVIMKLFKYFYRLFKKPVRVSPNNSLLFVSRASVAANAS
uniref:Dendritic cell-specific transmembrane protein-like domain-containing protein n=1 Tax=Panagrolaimus davidi TaxID=227884 RepID=A0A914QXU3_9BILA